MGGIERITGRIAADARAERESRLASARARAEDIRKSGEQSAETLRNELLDKARKDADNRYERLMSMAETDARKNILSVKQEMIDLAFSQAVEALSLREENEKIALLSALAAAASSGNGEEIILTPADHTRFGKRVLEGALEILRRDGKPADLRLSMTPRPLEGNGGLVLRDGDIEVNCSYGALVAAVKDEMTPEVAKRLFL